MKNASCKPGTFKGCRIFQILFMNLLLILLRPATTFGQNLGQDLLSDKDPHPMSDLSKPNYLQPIIDPEFGFFGRPEYDLGVMIGHLHLAGLEPRSIETVWTSYSETAGFNHSLALQFAGMEIMRRLIGVAQLPLSAELKRKTELLRLSEQLIVG